MHPLVVLLPAAALILGPRLIVGHVLKRHSREDGTISVTGGALARELLDGHQLQRVRVEKTDVGDHYDPEAKSVRLTRDKFDGKTLTAVVTAAHEVGHALQDASGYPPFRWRIRLAKVARIMGEVGTVMLLAVPASALITRNPMPPFIIGTTAVAIIGTGLAAQLITLPTEWNASFGRALPLLRDGHITGEQVGHARTMLAACSLTYVASSLAAVIYVWPWLPRRVIPLTPVAGVGAPATARSDARARRRENRGTALGTRARDRGRLGGAERVVRTVLKPLLKGWLGVRRSFDSPRPAMRSAACGSI